MSLYILTFNANIEKNMRIRDLELLKNVYFIYSKNYLYKKGPSVRTEGHNP